MSNIANGTVRSDGKKELGPATARIAPRGVINDQRALGAVRNDETVDEVMQLTPIATSLVHRTAQHPRSFAVRRILHIYMFAVLLLLFKHVKLSVTEEYIQHGYRKMYAMQINH